MRRRIDADSFLPLCAYEALPESLPQLRSAQFNCFKPWNGLPMDIVLPAARDTGMQLIKQVQVAACEPRSARHCGETDGLDGQILEYQRQIAAAKSDPAILAWYIEEEPTACINEPSSCPARLASLNKFHAAIRTVDAVHPTFVLDITPPSGRSLATWSAFNVIGEIAVIDNYPFHHGNERTLEASAEAYTRLRALSHAQKPFWSTIQAFGMPPVDGSMWSLPSRKQVRAEVFTALIHGATGVIYFAWDSPYVRSSHVIGFGARTPRMYPGQAPQDAVATKEDVVASQNLWQQLADMNAELLRLKLAILAPTSAEAYSVSVRGRSISKTPIRTMLKDISTSRRILFAVNIDDIPLEVSFKLPSQFREVAEIDGRGDKKPLATKDGKLTVPMEEFDVRIFELTSPQT